jgi:hypothetical protein
MQTAPSSAQDTASNIADPACWHKCVAASISSKTFADQRQCNVDLALAVDVSPVQFASPQMDIRILSQTSSSTTPQPSKLLKQTLLMFLLCMYLFPSRRQNPQSTTHHPSNTLRASSRAPVSQHNAAGPAQSGCKRTVLVPALMQLAQLTAQPTSRHHHTRTCKDDSLR